MGCRLFHIAHAEEASTRLSRWGKEAVGTVSLLRRRVPRRIGNVQNGGAPAVRRRRIGLREHGAQDPHRKVSVHPSARRGGTRLCRRRASLFERPITWWVALGRRRRILGRVPEPRHQLQCADYESKPAPDSHQYRVCLLTKSRLGRATETEVSY